MHVKTFRFVLVYENEEENAEGIQDPTNTRLDIGYRLNYGEI
jgi:hypothetical protein